jgi:hypothetical protein
MTDRQGRNQTLSDGVGSPVPDRHGHTPMGVSDCPEDQGFWVEIIFSAARSVVITVAAAGNGCIGPYPIDRLGPSGGCRVNGSRPPAGYNQC